MKTQTYPHKHTSMRAREHTPIKQQTTINSHTNTHAHKNHIVIHSNAQIDTHSRTHTVRHKCKSIFIYTHIHRHAKDWWRFAACQCTCRSRCADRLQRPRPQQGGLRRKNRGDNLGSLATMRERREDTWSAAADRPIMFTGLRRTGGGRGKQHRGVTVPPLHPRPSLLNDKCTLDIDFLSETDAPGWDWRVYSSLLLFLPPCCPPLHNNPPVLCRKDSRVQHAEVTPVTRFPLRWEETPPLSWDSLACVWCSSLVSRAHSCECFLLKDRSLRRKLRRGGKNRDFPDLLSRTFFPDRDTHREHTQNTFSWGTSTEDETNRLFVCFAVILLVSGCWSIVFNIFLY